MAHALFRGHCLCRVFCPDSDHRRRRSRLFPDSTRPGRVHRLPQTIFGFVGDKLQNPLGSDITVPRVVFAGLGGTVMAGLMYARHRFINWPLHYLGLPIATSLPISLGWFSIMIGWLFKLFIVRYGGVRLYRTIRPFFIGLIAGQISCGASWMAIDYLTGMVGNWVSVGVP